MAHKLHKIPNYHTGVPGNSRRFPREVTIWSALCVGGATCGHTWPLCGHGWPGACVLCGRASTCVCRGGCCGAVDRNLQCTVVVALWRCGPFSPQFFLPSLWDFLLPSLVTKNNIDKLIYSLQKPCVKKTTAYFSNPWLIPCH